jgi:hypothetical protein
MSNIFDYEMFASNVNAVYRAMLPASNAVDLRLCEVSKLGSQGSWRHFSVTLRGPEDTFLPQGIYTLSHQQQPGGLDIFLVPVGRDIEGFIYEANFNYQVNQI